MHNFKISLKGPYPPNIGGVSIHISRLAKLLYKDGILGKVYNTSPEKNREELEFEIYDASYPRLRYGIFQSMFWLIKFGLEDNSTIIHIHGQKFRYRKMK